MTMCGICWFDGRALTDEIDDLRQRVKEAEAQLTGEQERATKAEKLWFEHSSERERLQRLVMSQGLELEAANAKGHRAVQLCMEAEDRERRLASQSIRAEKERDIVVGILTQARCYIDSPRFDEEGEFTGMVDDILKKMP